MNEDGRPFKVVGTWVTVSSDKMSTFLLPLGKQRSQLCKKAKLKAQEHSHSESEEGPAAPFLGPPSGQVSNLERRKGHLGGGQDSRVEDEQEGAGEQHVQQPQDRSPSSPMSQACLLRFTRCQLYDGDSG